MPYMIDGHNLIGSLPGIDLAETEDEQRLLALLRQHFARIGRRATVYFDRGSLLGRNPPTQSGVTVHFTRPPSSADAAIRGHLRRLGGEAKNWTIVSSDREVRRAAQRAGARVISSQAFARELQLGSTQSRPGPEAVEKPVDISQAELEDWLRLFSGTDFEEDESAGP